MMTTMFFSVVFLNCKCTDFLTDLPSTVARTHLKTALIKFCKDGKGGGDDDGSCCFNICDSGETGRP